MAKTRLKLKTYRIVSEAIDNGITWGLSRVYKYTDAPTKEDFHAPLYENIMACLDDVVNFDEDEAVTDITETP